nr:GNAT family N-acetyltransferase [Chryseolinea lacunae]
MLLREFSEADAVGMFALNNDPLVIQYTGDPPFASEEATRTFIQHYSNYKTAGYGRWTTLLKPSMAYIGWCGLSYNVATDETDLGFRFSQRYWNQGFATEAAKACLDYGFNTLRLRKIIGRAMKENRASIRVLEKIGMTFEKEFEAHGASCVKYFRTPQP